MVIRKRLFTKADAKKMPKTSRGGGGRSGGIPQDPKPGENVGMETGIGTTSYWNWLLTQNFEKCLSDEELEQAFIDEFPKRTKEVTDEETGKTEVVPHHQPVKRVRSFFNTGRYGHGPVLEEVTLDMIKEGWSPEQDNKLEGTDRSVTYIEGMPAGPGAKAFYCLDEPQEEEKPAKSRTTKKTTKKTGTTGTTTRRRRTTKKTS